ncbi:MAG TPA: hypothetical protein DDX92_06550 [Flavobacteriales bacterium]|nr:hypothetical protein [Flavobacteriales bacterium]
MNRKIASTLYFSLQDLRGEPVRKILDELMRTQSYSLHHLTELQAIRTKTILVHAVENVPYYRENYKSFRSQIYEVNHPEELETLMKDLPVLSKQKVLEHFNEFRADSFLERKSTNNITSGSSGNPLMFPCDNQSWAHRHANVYRVLKMYGVEPGDPYGYLFGLHWKKKSRRKVRFKDLLFNRVRVSAFSISRDTVPESFEKLRKKKVNHFIGYPSAMYDFIVLSDELGLPVRDLGLKCIMGSAEPFLPFQREAIEALTGSRCIDYYGSVEGGPGAFEGPEGLMQQFMESSYLYVNSSNEIFTTDYNLFSFPLIKYQIGDFVAQWHTSNRPLTFAHKLFGSVSGRSGTPILLPNGNTINANVPSYIFKNMAGKRKILSYRFVHDTSKKTLKLFIVPLTKSLNSLKEELEQEIRVGLECPCEIHFINELPNLPNAKHRDYIEV